MLNEDDILSMFSKYPVQTPINVKGVGECLFAGVQYVTQTILYAYSVDSVDDHWAVPTDCKLLLTPLSAITDEHAVEVAKIVGCIDKECPESDFKYWGDYIKARLIMKGVDDFYHSVKIFQYLISKGYAVPLFFGVDHQDNGKTAIECGIAIIKQ